MISFQDWAGGYPSRVGTIDIVYRQLSPIEVISNRMPRKPLRFSLRTDLRRPSRDEAASMAVPDFARGGLRDILLPAELRQAVLPVLGVAYC
jgi:hypothetical protein